MMRSIVVVLLTASVLLLNQSASAQTTRPAPTIPTTTDVLKIMRRAADYQLETQAAGGKKTNGWVRGAFYTGVMALYRASHDEKYLKAAEQWADAFDYKPSTETRNERHADDLVCGQVYLELYELKKDPERLAGIQQRVEKLMATPKAGRVDWWWCDALYMAPPMLARLAHVTGDERYLTYLDEMYWDAHNFLYDPQEHLFFRDKSWFEKETKSGKHVFWSRGNGWVIAGLARVLEYLPANHPTRQKYVALFQEMAAKLKTLQGEDGLWRPSLIDPEDIPTGETSGTAFDTFAMAWGINHGLLDREQYLPTVLKGWRALCDKVTSEGKLGYVQGVAGGPGAVKPEFTHEYAVGAFLLAGSEIMKLARSGGTLNLSAPKFDFGSSARVANGYVAIDENAAYDAKTGYGWLDNGDAVLRDREQPDDLRRDYVFGRAPAKFRIDLKPGLWHMQLIMGDTEFGNHELQPSVNVDGVKLPQMNPSAGEYATLDVAFEVKESPLVVTFDSPVENWVVNGMSFEPAEKVQEPVVKVERLTEEKAPPSWDDIVAQPDPTAPLLKQFREDASKVDRDFTPTHIKRDDYLKLIAGNVDFFKQHQNDDGAIIDPYKNIEWQYSTPCFASSAATLIVRANRKDLLEPCIKAMDWATQCLHDRTCAQDHSDFYAPNIAHAMKLLKGKVDAKRYAKWEENIRTFNPFGGYHAAIGAGNWNVVSSDGEYLFSKLGLRDNTKFVADSLRKQARSWGDPWGLYTEGPMPYDHFPRMWAADMLASGYDGEYSKQLGEQLRRAAITSLFMQSPNGELPAGGRSAHHQWNEAEQVVTYEIYAAKAKAAGDDQLAGAFKRAAHLAFQSMQRWQRPSGEMWIVKNRVDPEQRFGYESYSSHSQYNLLPMAMLAIAYEHADATENVKEQPAPCEVGGFVLNIRPTFHKVFANAGGMYVEIETGADHHYNATGLIRVHKKGFNPQLGPSDSLTTDLVYEVPKAPRTDAAIGIGWRDANGKWRRLAEYETDKISSIELKDVQADPSKVTFTLIYHGYFSGPSQIVEHYTITPTRVELKTELPNYTGPVQMAWPVFDDIGDAKTTISVKEKTVSVTLADDTQTYTLPDATKIEISQDRYGFHNGFARVAVADFKDGTTPTIVIEPKPK
jgi:rhamnogalacturonyl hydrolase YesR